jgi:hypothetical protein
VTSGWPGARPLAIPELLRALNEARVEYVVIGGYALAAHRYVRGTDDLDIVPKPVRVNMQRLVKAVEGLEAVPVELEGGFRPEELPVQFGLQSLLAGGTWALSTRYGILHIMQAVPGAEDYEELRANAKSVSLEDVGDVLFVGREQLIRMKRSAGRLKDQADVEELLRRGDAGA